MTPRQRGVVIASSSALLIAMSGCATYASSHVIHAVNATWTATRIAQFVRGHPMSPDAPLRLDEISRTASSSVHIAQIRGAQAPHSHRAHDLAAIVRHGRGEIRIGQQVFPIAPGDVIELPRGTRHAVVSRGSQPLVAIVIFTPPFDGQDVVGEP